MSARRHHAPFGTRAHRLTRAALATLASVGLSGCFIVYPAGKPPPELPDDIKAPVAAVIHDVQTHVIPRKVSADITPPAADGHGPYPLVLVHGFSGFTRLGPLHYFNGVAADLRAEGYDVHVPSLPPYQSTRRRAQVLAAFIDAVRAQTHARKVHIVAHSQGGIDARTYVTELGGAEFVDSVVTIATPHRGTTLADHARGLPDGGLDLAARTLGWLIGRLDDPQDTENPETGGAWQPSADGALDTLSSDGMAFYNEMHPDPAGLDLYSIAGVSNLMAADELCADAPWGALERVDAQDPLLYAAAAVLAGDPLEPRANDGIVPTDSMVWGQFLGCVAADHFDQIGQIADVLPNVVSGFDHKQFYRDVAVFVYDEETRRHADDP